MISEFPPGTEERTDPGVGSRGYVLPAALLLLVLAVYADPLFTARSFVGRDLVPYNLPLEKAVHDAWGSGRIPVWWNAVSGGRPLLPNPNAGVFYPPRVLLAALSFPLAMRLFPILHWILAGWGMLLLVRTAGGSRAAAWVASVSFAFSGVLISEVFYFNFLPGAALLPWSLWALGRSDARARRLPRSVPIALVYGAMLLAGDAFSIAIALLAAVLWILLETEPGDRLARAGSLLGGLLLAGLLALPQIAATALVAPETRRMISGFRLREALGFSIPPARLLETAIPYPFGPAASMDRSLDWGAAVFRRFFPTFFVGPVALLGLLRRFRERPRVQRFARVLTLACVALALIGNVIPEAWGDAPSPIPLRYPEKFMLGASLGMALAAGIAVDGLRRERSRAALAVSGVLALAAAAALRFPIAAGAIATALTRAPASLGLDPLAGRQLPGALAVAGLLWMATALAVGLLASPADRFGRPAAAAGVLLLTLVPIAGNRPIAHAANEGTVLPPTAFARRMAQRDPHGLYRELDESIYQVTSLQTTSDRGDPGGSEFYRQSGLYFTPSLWGRGTVLNGDLDAGDFSRLDSLRQVSYLAARRADSEPFFSSLGLRFGVRFRDQTPVAGFQPFGGDAFRFFDENPRAKPEIRLLESWREEAGPVEALRAMSRLEPGQAVIESGRTARGSARPGRVRIPQRSADALTIETESPDPAWLFVLRGDWAHRTVTLDGQPIAVRPAQLAFSAIRIPSGAHRVEWRENAPGLWFSRWGPVVALLGMAAATVAARKGR